MLYVASLPAFARGGSLSRTRPNFATCRARFANARQKFQGFPSQKNWGAKTVYFGDGFQLDETMRDAEK